MRRSGSERRRRRVARAAGTVAAVALAIAALAGPAARAAEPPPAAGAAATAPAEARLAELEAALRRAPDDLRAGSLYRQTAIAAGASDRAIDFFTALAERHPESAAVRLGLGYAYVDKIPEAGAITQVILANTAVGHFTAALEIEESWLVRYTRGNSYVYWPPIFGKTALAVADLERAIALAAEAPKRALHARAWVALGDAHWRSGEKERARETWRQGLARYPDDADLEARLSRQDDELAALFDELYALGRRVDTDLTPLWEER